MGKSVDYDVSELWLHGRGIELQEAGVLWDYSQSVRERGNAVGVCSLSLSRSLSLSTWTTNQTKPGLEAEGVCEG